MRLRMLPHLTKKYQLMAFHPSSPSFSQKDPFDSFAAELKQGILEEKEKRRREREVATASIAPFDARSAALGVDDLVRIIKSSNTSALSEMIEESRSHLSIEELHFSFPEYASSFSTIDVLCQFLGREYDRGVKKAMIKAAVQSNSPKIRQMLLWDEHDALIPFELLWSTLSFFRGNTEEVTSIMELKKGRWTSYEVKNSLKRFFWNSQHSGSTQLTYVDQLLEIFKDCRAEVENSIMWCTGLTKERIDKYLEFFPDRVNNQFGYEKHTFLMKFPFLGQILLLPWVPS